MIESRGFESLLVRQLIPRGGGGVKRAHLKQVELVDPEDLLGALPVVDHPALGGQLRVLVQQLRVELRLNRLH